MEIQKRATLHHYDYFNPQKDGDDLRSAMKGMGTDEDTLIKILTNRTYTQRQIIAQYFTENLKRDLISDLKSELSGKFLDVIMALMSPDEYLCKQLNKAVMDSEGEDILIEIICSKKKDGISSLLNCYEQMYGSTLANHLYSTASNNLRKLLAAIVTINNDSGHVVDLVLAKEQALQLFEAGVGRFSAANDTFANILTHANFNHVAQVFLEYEELTGNTMHQAMGHELCGNELYNMKDLVDCIESPTGYFAKKLYKALQGASFVDKTLIRIIVCRCEIDLAVVKGDFERIFDKSLATYVKLHTSGDYKRSLLALLK